MEQQRELRGKFSLGAKILEIFKSAFQTSLFLFKSPKTNTVCVLKVSKQETTDGWRLLSFEGHLYVDESIAFVLWFLGDVLY